MLFVLVSPVPLALLAGSAEAVPPQPLGFNNSASADVRGPVQGVAVDGRGNLGAVAVGDLPQDLFDLDLYAFNLQGFGSRAWEASDDDLLREGGRLVAVANGTSGQAGEWVLLVNNTAPNILTAYQGSGFGRGGLGKPAWQHPGDSGTIADLDMGADGRLIALATGAVAQNKSYMLLQNRFLQDQPRVLYRASSNATAYPEVTRFTSVALSVNSTIPTAPDTHRRAYAVVGAETLSQGLIKGAVYVFQTVFSPLVESPTTTQVFGLATNSPVTAVDITADGEYAVAGTQDGQVYLISVSAALVNRGAGDIDADLQPWQASTGSRVNAIDIADWGAEFFAAGTDSGEVFVFRNQLNPGAGSRFEGSRGLPVGRGSASTGACNPTLSGPVRSLALSDYGEELVVGVQNGVLSYEAAAMARFGLTPFEPSWCIPYSGGDVQSGVSVDVGGDGRTVFAATGHRVFGYRNFYRVGLDPDLERRSVGAGQRATWVLAVHNDGSLFDRVNLSASGPLDPGWRFDVSNSSLLLLPGKDQKVLLNVTSPPGIQPGNFTINVIASAERSGLAQSRTLRLDVSQNRAVEVRPPPGRQSVTGGGESRVPITIHNGGNAPDRFRVSALIPEPQDTFKSPGSEWVIRVDPVEIEVPANGDGVVNLVVQPLAQRGDFALVTVAAEFAVNPEGLPGDAKQVELRIEPTFNGDLAIVETKDFRAEPGQVILVNFTVRNLGNTRDIFLIENRTEPPLAPGWRLHLSDQRIELRRQNEQKVVMMDVTAQQGLQPGESLRIVVDLFSDGLRQQSPTSDGKVDSVSLVVTVIPKARRGLPLVEEPLLLLGVLGLAVALRRRD